MLFTLVLFSFSSFSQTPTRQHISLNAGWKTIASNDNKTLPANSYQSSIDKTWKTVNVPHNWDVYHGYRRLLHGNLHGDSWYRKSFNIRQPKTGKRFFLFFEGVGSYATVFLNGKKIGAHAGGRTTFTIDITETIKTDGSANQVAVRAHHPANIKDLPWVCGGCSDERGFSEGSQPMGIFRPVELVVTNDVRIQPFGVHAWNDSTVHSKMATINLTTTLKNYSAAPRTITIVNQLEDAKGVVLTKTENRVILRANQEIPVAQKVLATGNLQLWDLQNPYLYKIKTSIFDHGKLLDELVTPYGIRWIKWLYSTKNSSNQFLLNGIPVFINGVAEYEHLLGGSHAFSSEQVSSRARMVKAAGFNAFRDGHQPHNLRYQHYWDSLGILSWTQHTAHIWYDSKAFRENFKNLLKEWVIERRNSPSVVLWGLQNESKLPKDFAEECVALVRSLDPTSSSQRLVTSCNGGEGTDWNIPQNWTGTYGGDPATYATDLKKQVLVGEYGAWRTIDLHAEKAEEKNAGYTEEKMTRLMELKVKLAESVKDSVSGHFAWLLTSHDNPGRVQGGEGYRESDRIGPVNYKGLLTPWEEPLDVFYMYRSNYAPKEKEPMVYIVSHTWPSRWVTPGVKDNIVVYSNCDEVELFNDLRAVSLGKRKKAGVGTHFQWDSAHIRYNVLLAVGYVNGKVVAKDTIVLQNLPASPNFKQFDLGNNDVLKPQAGYHYVCRINCGGPDYNDSFGNRWSADRVNYSPAEKTFTSSSWTKLFPEVPPFFASQRKTGSPISGTNDWSLFQSFRYGRDDLSYNLPVQDGNYLVELYFAEPWWGIGGGLNAVGFRLFDVAINGNTVLTNVDIWKEAGVNRALKKIVKANITGGNLRISFPNVRAGQAVIAAIAVASLDAGTDQVKAPKSLIADLRVGDVVSNADSWLDIGTNQFADSNLKWVSLPSNLFGADWVKLSPRGSGQVSFKVRTEAEVFIAMDTAHAGAAPKGFEKTNTIVRNNATTNNHFAVYKKRLPKHADIAFAMDSIKGLFVIPTSRMQPAYDLKATVAYRAATAITNGDGFVRSTVNERETISFRKNQTAVEWKINIGAADIYSLTIRYANTSAREAKGRLEILMADGTIFKKENIVFTVSREGKWNYISTNTGSMVNAGNYKIRIVAEDAVGVGISGLDIQ